LLDSDEEGRCWDSIATLAYKCGVSESTVKRTLKKLVKAKVLIVRSGKQYYTSNIYEVQSDALLSTLPAAKLRFSVGPIAEFLASHYYALVKNVWRTPKNGHNKYRAKVERGWEQHWGLVFQNWLDDGRTQEQIGLVVGWAFSQKPILASRGPQCLKKHFAKFLSEATAANRANAVTTLSSTCGTVSLRSTVRAGDQKALHPAIIFAEGEHQNGKPVRRSTAVEQRAGTQKEVQRIDSALAAYDERQRTWCAGVTSHWN